MTTRRARWFGVIFIAAVATFGAPGLAQVSSPETELDTLIDASASADGAIAAARGQADGGDLLGAAATLERALLQRPGAESDNVRLYYAGVLCRLDDRRRAAYQLGNVGDPAATGWAEARAACGDLAVPATAAPRRDMTWGELSAGLAYDGDAYGALATQLDLPTVASLADDGISLTTTARIDTRVTAGTRGGIYAVLSFASKDSIDGPKLDYQIGTARVGFATQAGTATELTVGGVVRHARVLGDPFVTEAGAQASIAFDAGDRSRWSIEGEVVGQDYHGGVLPSLRDGTRYDLAVRYSRATGEHLGWAVGAAFELKDADLKSLGYTGFRGFAGAQLPLAENGTYLGLSGTVRRVDYRDPAVGADLKEWRLFTRAAVGVPLGRDGIFLEPAVSYTARLYNDASGLRDYDSFGAELRLVFRF